MTIPSLARSLFLLALTIPLSLTACRPPTLVPTYGATGRIAVIAAVDDPDRPHNVALGARVPASGQLAVAPLWEADSEISDWLPSPDGRRAMYREVWHYVPKTEALVVRDLTAGAAPRYVVMGEPELSRLAGQVWSPDGGAVAYGLQAGDAAAFSGSGGTRRWEMRAVTLSGSAADRRLFALDGALLGSHVYTLLAWWPARSRAALLESPGGGGSAASAVRIHDTTDGRLVARVSPGGDDPLLAASPDGRRVAWVSPAAGVGTIDVATGAWQAIAAIDEGEAAFSLAWSHDGRWLAWAAERAEAGVGRGGGDVEAEQGAMGGQTVVVSAVRADGWRRTTRARQATVRVDAADGGLGELALSPEGDVALLTDVASGGRSVVRGAMLERRWAWPGGSALPSSEQAWPSGVWGMGWWP